MPANRPLGHISRKAFEGSHAAARNAEGLRDFRPGKPARPVRQKEPQHVAKPPLAAGPRHQLDGRSSTPLAINAPRRGNQPHYHTPERDESPLALGREAGAVGVPLPAALFGGGGDANMARGWTGALEANPII